MLVDRREMRAVDLEEPASRKEQGRFPPSGRPARSPRPPREAGGPRFGRRRRSRSTKPSVGDEVLIAHLEEVDAAAKRGGQRLAAEIGKDEAAIGPQIPAEALEHLRGQDALVARSGYEHGVRVQARREGDAIEVVEIVPRQGGAGGLGDHLALTATAPSWM